METEPESRLSPPCDLEALTMDVDSFTITETESRQETMQSVSSGEASSSSSQAAAARPPTELTPLALKALEKEGTQVLVCLGSSRMLFSRSKAPEGNSSVPGTLVATPSDPDEIFADVDPDYHMLYVQQGGRTTCFPRPILPFIWSIKAMIRATSRRKVKPKRKQQILEKEGGSCPKPIPKLPGAIGVRKPVAQNNKSCLIVIKKVSGDVRLRPSNHRLVPKPEPKPSFQRLMELAREKEMGCSLQVVFADWKLSVTALSALPLVPSLESHLPWFYMAESSQFNHIFGNMTTRQSFLVANSDLQSSFRLLYSKDGWLLLQGREQGLSSGRRFRSYPVFLFNPTTGVRLDLPSIDLPSFSISEHAAFFATSESAPEVVIFVRFVGRVVRIYMVRPGGACWEQYPYEFKLFVCQSSTRKLILCGSYVYCFFPGSSLIFNLADLSWRYVAGGSLPACYLVYFEPVEVEGKVVMVRHPQYFNNPLLIDPATFFRMEISGGKFEWEKITAHDEEIDGRIWYIHDLQSFCVKVASSGHRMCWFARSLLIERGHLWGTAYALHCLNLTTQAHCRLTADSVICSQPAWVDLGCPSNHSLSDSGLTVDEILPGF